MTVRSNQNTPDFTNAEKLFLLFTSRNRLAPEIGWHDMKATTGKHGDY
jgi:hypothetical protein